MEFQLIPLVNVTKSGKQPIYKIKGKTLEELVESTRKILDLLTKEKDNGNKNN